MQHSFKPDKLLHSTICFAHIFGIFCCQLVVCHTCWSVCVVWMEIFCHKLLCGQVNEAEKYLFNSSNPCRCGRKSTACCHTVSYDVQYPVYIDFAEKAALWPRSPSHTCSGECKRAETLLTALDNTQDALSDLTV